MDKDEEQQRNKKGKKVIKRDYTVEEEKTIKTKDSLITTRRTRTHIIFLDIYYYI